MPATVYGTLFAADRVVCSLPKATTLLTLLHNFKNLNVVEDILFGIGVVLCTS